MESGLGETDARRQAARLLRGALKIGPADARVLARDGIAAMTKGGAVLTKVLMQAWVMGLRSHRLEREGRMKEALESADRAISLSPRQPALLAQRAHLLLHLKRYAESARTLSLASRLSPRDAALRLGLAEALWLGGRLRQALREARGCLRLGPVSHEVRLGAEWFEVLAGNERKAELRLSGLARSADVDLAAGARVHLGALELRKSRFAAAAARFESAGNAELAGLSRALKFLFASPR